MTTPFEQIRDQRLPIYFYAGDVDQSERIGLIQWRAPNRYRKLMRNEKLRELEKQYRKLAKDNGRESLLEISDPWGCDYDSLDQVNDRVIKLQIEEFGIQDDWAAIGIGATIDNDWAVQWSRRRDRCKDYKMIQQQVAG